MKWNQGILIFRNPIRVVRRLADSIASRGSHSAIYLLIGVMPLSVFLPFTTPLERDVHPMFVSFGIDLSEIAAALVVLCALLGKQSPSTPRERFVLPLLAIAVLGFVTAPFAVRPSLAVWTACRWALASAVCGVLPRVQLRPHSVVIVLMATLGLHTLIGLGQIVLQGPIGLPGELALAPAQRGAAVLLTESDRWLRPYGLTFHPNVLAGFLAVGLILSLPLVDRGHLRLLWWLLWLGLFLTFSRSAWLASGVAMPFAIVRLYRDVPELRSALLRTGLGALVIALVASSLTSKQLTSRLRLPVADWCQGIGRREEPSPAGAFVDKSSVSDRMEMARLSLRIVAARPATGVGAGAFPLAMLATHSRVDAQYVHNVPLLLAAEVGLAGGVAWLWLWGLGARVLVRKWRRLSRWEVVSISAWLALATIALFDSYPWSLSAGRLLTTTLLGLAAADAREDGGSLPRGVGGACYLGSAG